MLEARLDPGELGPQQGGAGQAADLNLNPIQVQLLAPSSRFESCSGLTAGTAAGTAASPAEQGRARSHSLCSTAGWYCLLRAACHATAAAVRACLSWRRHGHTWQPLRGRRGGAGQWTAPPPGIGWLCGGQEAGR